MASIYDNTFLLRTGPKGKEILIVAGVNMKIEYIDLTNFQFRYEIELVTEAFYTDFISL